MEVWMLLLTLCVGNGFAVPIGSFHHPPMENPDLFGGDIVGIEPDEDKNAVVNKTRLWPGGIIPYVEDPGLKSTIRYMFLVERAMEQYHKSTCIKFVPRTDEEDYIRLFPGQGSVFNNTVLKRSCS
ncbi:metalloendopeptidase [Nephila pilipes]|uniref:Metalloendopeptidase n=1 Tax=Nephila pilipes TaxID=299642 RepID=A0A8X6IQK5_NEPPI|nr:metalloendopeptidase [Nephila pilipes]